MCDWFRLQGLRFSTWWRWLVDRFFAEGCLPWRIQSRSLRASGGCGAFGSSIGCVLQSQSLTAAAFADGKLRALQMGGPLHHPSLSTQPSPQPLILHLLKASSALSQMIRWALSFTFRLLRSREAQLGIAVIKGLIRPGRPMTQKCSETAK